MDTPTYTSTIIIGGSTQTTSAKIGSVLPLSINTRQSGSIVLTAKNPAGAAFSLSTLNGTEVFAKPINSAEVPISLGNGVVTGGDDEIFTISWPRDTFAAGWSAFPFDKDGTIVIYTQMEETGVADFFMWSTRVNVEDGDFNGDSSAFPSTNTIFYYNPTYGYSNTTTAADPGAGLFRANNTLLSSITELYINDFTQSNVDLQTYWQGLSVGSTIYIGNPNVKLEAAYFTVSGTPTDGTDFTTVPVTFVSAGTSQFTNGSQFAVTIDASELGLTPEQVAAGTDNNQTGTAYTLVLTDADNKTVTMTNAAANVVTIPLNASVAFPIGTKIPVMQYGAGVTTSTGDTGVTVNNVSAGSVAASSQFNGMLLHKIGTDTWAVSGG